VLSREQPFRTFGERRKSSVYVDGQVGGERSSVRCECGYSWHFKRKPFVTAFASFTDLAQRAMFHVAGAHPGRALHLFCDDQEHAQLFLFVPADAMRATEHRASFRR
jgi:hypothetical protein